MDTIQTNTYSNTAATNTKVDAVAAGSKLKLFIRSFTCFNPDAANAAYVQFFDALAANVTLGTTTPKFVLPLPAKGGVDGLVGPRMFATNICFAVTATATGSEAPSSNCIVQFDYL